MKSSGRRQRRKWRQRGGSSSSGDRGDGVRGAAGPKANPGAGGAKRRDGSDAASPDDDEGATGGSRPRNPSHQAEGMDTMPVETLQAEPPEPSAESVFVNVLLEPYLW